MTPRHRGTCSTARRTGARAGPGDGYTGGYWGGYTGPGGVLPSHRAPGSSTQNQRSGPRKPNRGLEWVGSGCWDRPLRVSRYVRPIPLPTPAGPGRSCRPSLAGDWPSSSKRARFQSIFSKVSQKDEVSSKKCQKACHSPYSQNGAQKSPLDFLRFPYLTAFSPKELMGLF